MEKVHTDLNIEPKLAKCFRGINILIIVAIGTMLFAVKVANLKAKTN